MGIVVRVRGVKRWRDKKTGRWYCQHRKTGSMIKEEFGSAEFFVVLAELNRVSTGVKESKAGSLGLLIASYKAHSSFTDLADRTRKDYQRVFDYLAKLDAMPIAKIDRAFCAGVREKVYKAHGRRFANYVIAGLSVVFSFGMENEGLDNNPCFRLKKVKRPKSMEDANRPWEPHERDAVLEALAFNLKVPIALAMFAALREGDCVKISKANYNGRELRIRTAKTGQLVWWPCPAPLREILDAAPASDATTLAVNSRGKPWTESGLRASWRKVRIELEKAGKVQPGLTIHGLRHTVATMLAEIGYDDQTIADALGQATAGMAAHYSKRAQLKKKMAGVVVKMDRAENKRRKASVKTAD